MNSELSNTLMGLIALHDGVTGYELHSIIKNSTEMLLNTSLSRIYPTLKSLHGKSLVTFDEEAIPNRPSKKLYHLTATGREELNAWLAEPIEPSLSYQPFTLKMAFAPLMDRQLVLQHVDREIAHRERMRSEDARGLNYETDYLPVELREQQVVQRFWQPLMNMYAEADAAWLAALKAWREELGAES